MKKKKRISYVVIEAFADIDFSSGINVVGINNGKDKKT